MTSSALAFPSITRNHLNSASPSVKSEQTEGPDHRGVTHQMSQSDTLKMLKQEIEGVSVRSVNWEAM